MTASSEPKGREFWILESRCTGKKSAHKTQMEAWCETQHNDNEIHVIEKSAYTAIQRERDAYRKECEWLKKALEFYAQGRHIQTYWATMPEGYMKPTTQAATDDGAVARDALAEFKKRTEGK